MAGLIVTCARHFEPDACDEIEKILADLGDESAYAKATSMSGIITVETSLDPENAINDVRALIDDEPWVVRYLMRLIPITKNGLYQIQNSVCRFISKICKNFFISSHASGSKCLAHVTISPAMHPAPLLLLYVPCVIHTLALLWHLLW